jgi:putative RecB family exonuclease
MRDHLSVSQINVYLACPLKYRFQYVDEIPRAFTSSSLLFGIAIHSTLAWWHQKRIDGESVSREDTHRVFRADWFSQKTDLPILFKPKETEKALIEKGQALLALYAGEYDSRIPCDAEFRFEVPLVDMKSGEVLDLPLLGYMDLLEEADTVVEFKTAARSLNERDLRQHLQLTAYAYAYQVLFEQIPNLRLVSLMKTKRPRVEYLKTERNEKDFRRFFLLAREVLKGIRNGVFYPNGSWMCDGCEYWEACQKW